VLIADQEGRLKGLVTRGDLLRAMESDAANIQTVLEAGTESLLTAYADELLFHAASRMLRAGVGRLPVVDREDPTKILGYLGRSGVLSARLRQIEEEHVREPGWAFSKRRPKTAGEVSPVK